MKNKSAFTLVELLVVVLIIGILTAVAIPMYQSAVDKTHWSTLLPTARALKNAEEAYLMATNVYTDNADALDVAATQGDASYQLQMPDSAARYVIRATSDKLPNVRLAQYLDENASMAGQLHCEAKTGDERATKLCEKLLMGQELTTTDDGYTSYLLDQEVDKATCDSVSRSWSTSKTKCYKTTAERCEALGMPAISGQDQCGYVDTQHKTIGAEGVCEEHQMYGCSNDIFENGGVCKNLGNGCRGNQIKDGGICLTERNTAGCGKLTVYSGGVCLSYANGAAYDNCHQSTISGAAVCNGKNYCGYASTFNGGVCIANPSAAGGSPCGYATYKNDSVCFANASGACGNSSFQDTSCCCGSYCSGKPTCSAERCASAKSQYAQYFD